MVGVEVPQLGLAKAGLVVAQEEIDGALLLVVVPAVVDGAAQADQLVAHARRRLPVPPLVLEHRRVRAAAPVLCTQGKLNNLSHFPGHSGICSQGVSSTLERCFALCRTAFHMGRQRCVDGTPQYSNQIVACGFPLHFEADSLMWLH